VDRVGLADPPRHGGAAGAAGAPFVPYNDPDRADGPFQAFLLEARRELGGEVDPAGARVERVGTA
jgi:hypothetical protein